MCNIWSTYAVLVQIGLGFSILGVLFVEYFVELCRKKYPRTFVQFWFDSGKLCCGALVTHGFNLLVASIINNSVADECAVYLIAFYYEVTGITLVQMMQYGLVKYARRKYLERYHANEMADSMCGNIWYWISYPGHYTFKEQTNPSHFNDTSANATSTATAHNNHDEPTTNTSTNANGNIQTAAAINNAREDDNDDAFTSILSPDFEDSSTVNLLNDDRLSKQEILQKERRDYGSFGDETKENNNGEEEEPHEIVSNLELQQTLGDRTGDSKFGNIAYLRARFSSSFNLVLSLAIATLLGAGTALLGFYALGYPIYVDVILGAFAMIFVVTVSGSTLAVIFQTLSWVMIKVVERSLWTLFVWSQKSQFQQYSAQISLGPNYTVLEALLYIAICPLIIGCVMFWFFSNIARMNIPFINVEKFANTNIMSVFDLKEALKIGVYSTLLYNTVLWIPAAIAMLSWLTAGFLLLMMVVIPVIVNTICVVTLYLLLTDLDRKIAIFGRRRSINRTSSAAGTLAYLGHNHGNSNSNTNASSIQSKSVHYSNSITDVNANEEQAPFDTAAD